MPRDETVALFLQGREAWNGWAEKMLAKRKSLDEAGRWNAEKKMWGDLEPKNEETRAWMEGATADFSSSTFLVSGAGGIEEPEIEVKEEDRASQARNKSIRLETDSVDFTGFIFPGDAWFENANFSGDARFGSATFSGYAWFDGASFNGVARFVGANFLGDAWFEGATFLAEASFDIATFSAVIWFVSAVFRGTGRFVSTAFSGDAQFGSATFSGDASFRSATFQSSTSFGKAKFLKDADFKGMKVDRAFDMTEVEFAEVPAFNQADFKQAPDLDDVRFAPPGFWSMGQPLLIAEYRAIRRMAIQGADYEREQMAFKGELRSRRWRTDRPWHPSLWLGLFYDGVSDCGRSVVRPLLAWSFCIAVFAIYFLGQNEEMKARRNQHPEYGWSPTVYASTAWEALKSPPYCYPGTVPLPAEVKENPEDRFTGLVEKVRGTTNIVNEALSIAYHNAVIILDSSGDSAHRAFGCLYGVERYGGNPVAYVPRSVAIASGIQKLLSAIFIFLFGLAVRNMLKVK